MAVRRFRARSAGRIREPSQKAWFELATLGSLTGAFSDITTAEQGLAFAGLEKDHDETILRTRGLVTLFFSGLASPAAAYAMTVAVGMGIVTQEAGAAAAVPLPIGSADWDGWYLHQYFNQVVHTTFPDTLILSVSLDSKAMRKIPTGMVPLVVISAVTTSNPDATTPDMRFAISGRQLFKTS